MRGIKFRVYIEMENKVVDVCTIDFDEGTIGVLEINLMGYPYIKLWDFDQVKLMQDTGLKDKNGIDIYEGDIVKITILGDSNKTLGSKNVKVEFKKGRFGVQWGICSSLYDSINFISFDGFHSHTIEVIGNIHDNPELIEI